MERFIEVKSKSQPVYSKGYWIVDMFLGSVREGNINVTLKLSGQCYLLEESKAHSGAELGNDAVMKQ